VSLIAEKRAGGGRPQRGQAAALQDLGSHPQTGEPVRVLSGRYGPYIASGGVNANVPRGADPQAVTLDQAVALLAERAAKGGGKKPARKASASKAPAKKKVPAKTAAAKKPAARKKA
jgi:DNA topoisomerase-1